MSAMAKTISGSIFGVIRKESWILDHFEIFVNVALNAWRRSALSECFSSLFYSVWSSRSILKLSSDLNVSYCSNTILFISGNNDDD